ncbi:hypothetical protein Maes01_02466 [Microbulbifer aestuariivivens]|uniref:DUF4124 domain-containing protein n=1 Tax=Microbulbifer aestuariivivens TaxID=1908308 RepID=A0ABP9WUE6_9GAMM
MKIIHSILAGWLAVLAVGAVAQGSDTLPGKGDVLFRYTNEHGVPVLDNVVPPRFVPGGYEVLNRSGRVLEVVPPQLTEEEVARKRRQAAQRLEDAELLRRYSSLADIENALERKLATAEQDMALLRSNLSSIVRQIEQAEADAASIERNGDQVPPDLVARITNLREEVKVLKQRIAHRQEEAARIKQEFAHAAERFTLLASQ